MYAGIATKISREAIARVSIGRTLIKKGEHATLMLASANRDPEQFRDPDRLDVTRAAAGQVAFGAGSHACAGGALIRMAAAVATRALLRRLVAADATKPVVWRGGSGFRWAASLYVRLDGKALLKF